MKIKDGFTIESAVNKIRSDLSTHIKIVLRENLLNRNKKWIDIDKNAVVGLRVTFYSEGVLITTYVPNFFARMIFGGLIGGLFHLGARNKFKDQIESYLYSEFYES